MQWQGACGTPSDAQKISGKGKRRLEAKLKRCSGGTATVRPPILSLLFLFKARLAKAFVLVGHKSPCLLTTPPPHTLSRVNHHDRAACASVRFDGTASEVRQDKFGAGRAMSNPKTGGQELLRGVSVKITRNRWGPQVCRLCSLSSFLSVARR